MTTPCPWFKCPPLVWTLVLLFAWSVISVPGVEAGLASSRLADGASLSQRADDIQVVRQALEREVVAQKLADYGLTPEEAANKLESLDDEQLHQLASVSNSLGEGGVLGLVIAVLLIILLVYVIVDLNDREIVVQ